MLVVNSIGKFKLLITTYEICIPGIFSCYHCNFHKQNDPIPMSCWPLVVTSELGHKHLVACNGPCLCWELVGLCGCWWPAPPPGHHIDLEKVNILDRESHWFEGCQGGCPHLQKPTNYHKDGGCYKLPNFYDSVLTSLPKVSNSWVLGHSADESCSESNWKFQVCKFHVLWSRV